MSYRVVPNVGLTWVFDVDPTVGPGIPAPAGAFGVRTDVAGMFYHLSSDPVDWLNIGGGGGGGQTFQTWDYQVDGTEPDPSEIEIVVPVPFDADDYNVQITFFLQSNPGIPVLTYTDKTNVSFTLVSTDDLQVGDKISFFAAVLTSNPT